MKNTSLLAVEVIISLVMIWLGLSGKQFLWIHGPRSAAITLSAIGFVLCMASIGKFISASWYHPLTICGYILGVILMISMIAQIFGLNVPVVGKPETALVVIGICIILKGIIARFHGILVK
ncbi:MAG TPA: hypothetical protein VIL05_02135 [Thermoclostridium sp.]